MPFPWTYSLPLSSCRKRPSVGSLLYLNIIICPPPLLLPHHTWFIPARMAIHYTHPLHLILPPLETSGSLLTVPIQYSHLTIFPYEYLVFSYVPHLFLDPHLIILSLQMSKHSFYLILLVYSLPNYSFRNLHHCALPPLHHPQQLTQFTRFLYGKSIMPTSGQHTLHSFYVLSYYHCFFF